MLFFKSRLLNTSQMSFYIWYNKLFCEMLGIVKKSILLLAKQVLK